MGGLENFASAVEKNPESVVAAISAVFGAVLSGVLVKTVGSKRDINALKKKCFHPETKIKLQNGTVVAMKDLNLGDVLENGRRVDALMRLDNKYNNKYFIIPKKGVDGTDIYVTGTHMIFSESENKYVQVKDHSEAIETDITGSWFSSIVTDDHKINIGEHLFWDWRDDLLKN